MTEIFKYAFVVAASYIAFQIFSYFLRKILVHVNPELKGRLGTKIHMKDLGAWIGACEFVLILIFVFLNEYTAIAIIFAAKEIVRSEKIREDASYYLLGTLLNVCFSLAFSLIIKAATGAIFPST